MDSPVPEANDLECAPADTEVDEEHKAEVPEALGALESVLLQNEQHDSMIHASEEEEFVLQAFITSEMDFLMQSEAVELQSFIDAEWALFRQSAPGTPDLSEAVRRAQWIRD